MDKSIPNDAWKKYLPPADELKIEEWPGRKSVDHNGPVVGVKVTHTPTDYQSVCDHSRDQNVNREIALEGIANFFIPKSKPTGI